MREEKNWKNQLIDIHNHILPGIDDGSKDLATSLCMLRAAQEEGIQKIILTPHFKPGHRNASPDKIEKLLALLQDAAGKENLYIRLYPGNEIFFREEATKLLEKKQICTLAGTKYVLTEFMPGEEYSRIRNGIYQILAEGYQPVVAHVERYANVGKEIRHVKELMEMGAYIQVNAGSIMGNYGLKAKHFTRKLLANEWVHFVATDAHDMDKRPPRLRKCAEFVAGKYGTDYAKRLFTENPETLLSGEYL